MRGANMYSARDSSKRGTARLCWRDKTGRTNENVSGNQTGRLMELHVLQRKSGKL